MFKKIFAKMLIVNIFLTIFSISSLAKTFNCIGTGQGANLINNFSIVLNEEIKNQYTSGYMLIKSESIYYGKTVKISENNGYLFFDKKTRSLTASDNDNSWSFQLPLDMNHKTFITKITHTPISIENLYTQEIKCSSL